MVHFAIASFRSFTILLFLACLLIACSQEKTLSPDDTKTAKQLLLQKREQIRKQIANGEKVPASLLIKLGMWADLEALLDPNEDHIDVALWHFANNRFRAAEKVVEVLLSKDPKDLHALLLKSELFIQAWELGQAEEICQQILAEDNSFEDALYQSGKILLLKKDYYEARKKAKEIQALNPGNAKGYLLESDVYFWDQQNQKAEEPLIKALEIDPFLADGRFSYGYAIWRRVDASQLDDMAAQWELALELDPLHYITHWHWGNGHTHLTYADYAQSHDEELREALKEADSLFSKAKYERALSEVEKHMEGHPKSPLPLLYKGSFFYMMDETEAALDSAQSAFQRLLHQHPHYGPAHNGLAAVIKKKRFPYLSLYDSLEISILSSKIEQAEDFRKVFPSAQYYPGERIQKMIYSQLQSATAYLPMLAKLKREFQIQPLHIDLAIAMGNSYFREATTFDNRQWMDIRGVGSGATGIEYVERAAHLERNVTLHEYVHLFHGTLFTDYENRRTRALYHEAMEHNRALDYYAANNESEYLAQGFPAYFIPLKVHPLNHKSMNTRSDLEKKDPPLFAFIDSLVKKHEAFLEGNQEAMAGNWAQLYLRLAQSLDKSNGEENLSMAIAYLDTASSWDAAYLPVMLEYVDWYNETGRFEKAGFWMAKAIERDPGYAPNLQMAAKTGLKKWEHKLISEEEAIGKADSLMQEAFTRERDLAIRAQMHQWHRQILAEFGYYQEAIALCDRYLTQAPTLSTYLRDRKDESLAYKAWLESQTEESRRGLEQLAKIVQKKPQNYYHRIQYADALTWSGDSLKALQVLEESIRILSAAGNEPLSFISRLALLGSDWKSQEEYKKFLAEAKAGQGEDYFYQQWALHLLGESIDPDASQLGRPSPVNRARLSFLMALLEKNSAPLMEEALEHHPYFAPARLQMNSAKQSL